MRLSTAKTIVNVTAAITAVVCIVCLCSNAAILAVPLGVIGYFVMYAAARSISPGSKRPRAARRKFLNQYDRTLDTNELLVGSSAWVIANDLTGAFQTGDHLSFTDSLNAFDHDALASNIAIDFNNSSSIPSIIDYVHGGTDSTGMNGMGGHNDQGWGTDSPSSMSDSSFSAASHDSFSSGSSAHDPIA